MNKTNFTFPVGYHEFNKNQAFNFQLNRYYSMGLGRFEDMKEVGQKVNSLEEWKAAMLKLAEASVSKGRLMNAAFYYRASEFYLLRGNPEKDLLYEKFKGIYFCRFLSSSYCVLFGEPRGSLSNFHLKEFPHF